MKKFAIALLVSTLAIGVLAADKMGRMGTERFAAVDTDGDKSISREEASANTTLAGKFDQIDTDKDGKLSTAELSAYGKGNRGKGFKGLDANGDGSVTREEAQGSPLVKHFDQADTDKDGKVSMEEANAFKTVRKAAKPAA